MFPTVLGVPFFLGPGFLFFAGCLLLFFAGSLDAKGVSKALVLLLGMPGSILALLGLMAISVTLCQYAFSGGFDYRERTRLFLNMLVSFRSLFCSKIVVISDILCCKYVIIKSKT